MDNNVNVGVSAHSVKGMRITLAVAGVEVPGILGVEAEASLASHLVVPSAGDIAAAEMEMEEDRKRIFLRDGSLTELPEEKTAGILAAKAANIATANALSAAGVSRESWNAAKDYWNRVENRSNISSAAKATELARRLGGGARPIGGLEVQPVQDNRRPVAQGSGAVIPKPPPAPVVVTAPAPKGLNFKQAMALLAQGFTTEQTEVVNAVLGGE